MQDSANFHMIGTTESNKNSTAQSSVVFSFLFSYILRRPGVSRGIGRTEIDAARLQAAIVVYWTQCDIVVQ